jgi:protein arginine kinase
VLRAARDSDPDLHSHKGITNAERDHLVGCRLISSDFKWNQPGRALLLNEPRSLSVMVNEEDHIRLQVLTPGWSIQQSIELADRHLLALSERLEFAHSPRFGYLAASPYNAGAGRRLSCMFHLIGLAQTKRLPDVLKALSTKGITARGLFGESSRAIGAFVQVSVTGGTRSEFLGACEYLVREERMARMALGERALKERVDQAVEFATSARSLTLADSLRILAWLRWASSSRLEGFCAGDRRVDAHLITLPIHRDDAEQSAGRARADEMRRLLESLA